MKKQELDSLENERLIWACAEPFVMKTRGRSGSEKLAVYRELSGGQRSLYLFQVLYGHAGNGLGEFYAHISYLTGQLDIFAALKAAMRYFGDSPMLELVGKMESVFAARAKGEDDPESLEELNKLYRQYLPGTIAHISAHIRSHPEVFLQLEE